MKFQRTRSFAATAMLAVAAFSWTFLFAPVVAQARLVDPQSQSGIGAANGVGINNGIVAYISGKFIKYSDGVQAFGEVELAAVGEKLIQPSDTRTYAVDKMGTFYIIDTTNFNNPQILGTYQLPAGKCTDLDQFDANTVIVMNDNRQLAKIDVTDPAAPTCATTDNMGTQFESAGGSACLNDEGMLCKVNMGVNPPVKGALVDAGAEDISIDPAGDKVYSGGGNQLAAYDLTGSLLAAPVLLATFVILGTFLSLVAAAATNQVWVAFDEFGSMAFALFTLALGVFTQGVLNFSSLKGTPRMAIDPTNAAVLAVALISAVLILGIVASNLTLLYAFPGAYLITKVTFATILGILYLFASAHYSGLHLWNMNNPLAPIFALIVFTGYALWCFKTFAGGANQSVGALAAAGPYGLGAVDQLGFVSYDFTDPTTPAQLSNLFTGGIARDVAISGNYAYGADDFNGLQVINISNPAAMSLVKSVGTTGPAMRVHLEAGHAYVAADFAGIQIIDIATPASAAVVGSIPGLTGVTSITSDGTYLYFGAGNVLHIYDLVDPTAPAFVGSYALVPEATVADIAIVDVPTPALTFARPANKLAYVAAGLGGFVIVDVSTPATPSALASQPTGDFASSVAVNGNDVYLADGSNGFMTLDVDPAQVPVLFQGFSARINDGGVDLLWNFSADEEVLGLELYRSIGGMALPVKLHHEWLGASQRSFRDEHIAAGETYHYTVVAKTASGVDYRSPTVTVEVPMREMAMFPNYPNPFNPSTRISFDLPRPGHATLAIYDAAGRYVVTLVDNFLQAGINNVEWNGTNARGERVGSGVYVAKLLSNSAVLTQKLTLLK